MKTNLIGQYVVEGWNGEFVYNVITAVYLDRGVVKILAKNPDNHIVEYDAVHCNVVRQIP